MSSGNFIETDHDLRERNAWLEANATAVAPFLCDGRECFVFTYSRQEPADRATTRYGDLPFWASGQPWPACRACSLVRPQPLQFVGQLDFRHPRVRPTVPGDVLVFHLCPSCWPHAAHSGDDEAASVEGFRERKGIPLPALGHGFAYASNSGWSLTWQGDIAPSDLISAAELPAVPEASAIGPFYGQGHEVTDYPSPPEAYDGGIAGERYTYLHFTLQGTKIGGHRPPIQDEEDPVDSAGHRMRFLAAFGSVTADALGEGGASQCEGNAQWGDMGSILLWVSDHTDPPEMMWFRECY